MPPQRFQTLPPAQTSSAREALKSFYCDLCQKGYTRMNDYQAHLSSYDHSHKKRLKDMRAMVRDPNAAARARKQEAKAGGVISIKLGGDEKTTGSSGGGGGSGPGFKKGVFKKSGFKSAFVTAEAEGGAGNEDANANAKNTTSADAVKVKLAFGRSEYSESDTEDEGYEVYDPRHPTD